MTMPNHREPVLLVAACDFGWGSLGKLGLVLDQLPGIPVALDRAFSLASTVQRMLGDRHRFRDCPRADAAVGLVINDPSAADQMAASGLPVIYVDSLPYLWTTQEEIPKSVAVYCAQRAPTGLPLDSPLANRRDLRWVDPLVPKARGRRGGAGIVLNIGGLHSHLTGDSADAYLRLVLLPIARLLSQGAYSVSAVCGNLPAWAERELRSLFSEQVRIGAQTPHQFERTLSRADTLITSPGSTTLLQAAAIGLPTSLFPLKILAKSSTPTCIHHCRRRSASGLLMWWIGPLSKRSAPTVKTSRSSTSMGR
jgi:hydroxymethylcytosylglucuronate/cytosylglucuronate synthase